MIQWICDLLGLTWNSTATTNYNTYIVTIAAVIIVVMVCTFFGFLFRVLEGLYRK